MRQFTLLLLLTFLPLCYSFADNTEEPLYFISAKQFYDPYVYYDDDEYENAYLFSLQNGHLDTINALSSYEDRIKQIEYYVDLSTIIITTEQKYGKYSLSLLNTKNLDSWCLKYPISNEFNDTYFIYRIILDDDDNNYLSIEYYKDSSIFVKYEKDKEIEYLQQSKILNFQCTTKKTESITYDSVRNCFTLPIININKENDKLKRPIFPYKINKDDYLHGREITGMYIKNKEYSVILNGSKDKSRNFFVYQHKNDNYNIITIPGKECNANIWGEWLGGAEVYEDEIFCYSQKNNAVLYLYNIPQNRMIQWNSKSKNAAILHIENNEVYYRINDTLYKAPILEDSIGEPEVIWQSDILKNVHWLWK